MKQTDFSVEDFLADESFQSFAFNRNKEDIEYWSKWITEHPDKRSEFNEAITIFNSFKVKPIIPDAATFETDFNKLKHSIQPELKDVKEIKPFRTTWRIAASIVLLIGIIGVASLYVTHFYEKAEQIVVEKSVPNGSKLSFELPDGSHVKLNSNSYLRYEQNYILKQRKVTLRGEAYFDVAKDAANPFTVISGEISTTALGTSFNIKSYPEDNVSEVFLFSGKVEVTHLSNPDQNNLILEPGQGARHAHDDTRIIQVKLDGDRVLAWKDGVIKFTNASISEVVVTLERWYGITIAINNPPSNTWRINGTFENESLENVLSSMSYTAHFDFTLQDKKLILTF